jgi:hypothetical protein
LAADSSAVILLCPSRRAERQVGQRAAGFGGDIEDCRLFGQRMGCVAAWDGSRTRFYTAWAASIFI